MRRRQVEVCVAGVLASWLVQACTDGGGRQGPRGEIRAEPAAVDFGRVGVGGRRRIGVALVNASPDAAIVVSRIGFESGSSGAFSYEAELPGPGSTLEIPAGGSAAIGLSFAPSEAGAAGATLVVTNDSANQPALRVAASGEGVLCPTGRPPTDEFMIDASVVLGPAARGQGHPAVAFDGTNYFVAWEDGRAGDSTDIYGTRVGPDGTVLDPGGLRLSSSPASDQKPSVAFDGTNFLVVWGLIDGGAGGSGMDVQGARVSPDGRLLDPEPIAVSTAPDDQLIPSVDCDGTNCLAVWLDNRDLACDIYGARIDPSGTVLDPSGIPISSAPECQKFPAVRFGAGAYLVAWQDERSGAPAIYAARVDPAGRVLDTEGIPISASAAGQTFAAVAFDGTNWFVAWEDPVEGQLDIHGVRVDPSGLPLDAEPIPIAAAPADQLEPTVDFDGAHYLVIWTDSRNGGYDIYGARVDPSGIVLDPDGLPLVTPENSQTSPAVAFNGTSHLAAYSDTGTSWTNVRATRVGTDGSALDAAGTLVSVAANSQYHPAVASGRSGYFVAWSTDDESDSKDIYGVLVEPRATEPAAEPIPIAVEEGDQDFPSVCSDGDGYLVVWIASEGDGRSIYGSVVGGDGRIAEPGRRLLEGGPVWDSPPGVVFGGTEYLVVWAAPEEEGSGVFGRFVAPSGEPAEGDRITISSGEGDAYQAGVAFDGTNYLVVWTWQRSPFSPLYIVGRRLSRTGEVLNRVRLRISGEFSATQPAVTFGGGYYLVVWRAPGADSDIHGVRVAPDGEVLDAEGFFGISTAAGEQTTPATAFDGDNWLVTWEDGRARAGGARGTIQGYGSWVSPEGSFSESFAVSSVEGDAVAPALSADPCGDWLVVYSGWTSRDE
ncbi:MAG: hypothetical protein QME96_01675, partial [Myxococcota bacterium]|nr:hypothetical protein [Myxococcota bacterium]